MSSDENPDREEKHLPEEHPSEEVLAVKHLDVRYEKSDVNTQVIVRTAAGAIIAAVIITVGIWALYETFSRHENPAYNPPFSEHRGGPSPLPVPPAEFPEPRLQTRPVEDLRTLRSRDRLILDNYGWVDRNAGTVRIPIEQAMKIVAEKGLSDTPESKPEVKKK